MKKIHINALATAERLLKAVAVAHPDLTIEFKNGEFIAKEAASKRCTWGDFAETSSAAIKSMQVGDVIELSPPEGRSVAELQRYLAGKGNSIFGPGSITTAKNDKTNSVEVMRSL